MVGVHTRGTEIRQFILDNVEHHPRDVAALAARTFGISRQAINKHIKRLVEEKAITVHGTTKDRHYLLRPLVLWDHTYPLNGNLREDVVWRNDVLPRLGDLPANVTGIWHYGFTEMLNNAIDHSNGKTVHISVNQTSNTTEMGIHDDGEGIFTKIQRELGLDDERHAVLELAKGKLTTDPERHTGEDIFFASRMFDDFGVLSGSVYFSHLHDEIEDWIVERRKFEAGTAVFMKLSNKTTRTTQEVFDSFTSDEDYGFTKTAVPVRLAQYGDETLVSRSQAKRLLARFDRFKVVILDFSEVEAIGQAFADEVFRVFAKQHPGTEIVHLDANEAVERMITRALAHESQNS